jgi:gluconokinase
MPPTPEGQGGSELVVGLDLGTTSVKALALDAHGEVVARSARNYVLHSGEQGSATQDAEEVIQAALTALSELEQALHGQVVRAIVPSAAMHSLVLIGGSGEVLAPALTWADTRPSYTLSGLHVILDAADSYARTGCPLQAPYHPARLWWLQQTQPEVFARTALFVSLTDLLLHRLTGRWVTSVGLASTTGLWNHQTAQWDAGILQALGLGEFQLPVVHDAREVAGTVQAGPLKGVPVLAGSTDGALANLGTGADMGEAVVTVGTSGAVRRLASTPHLDPQARTWSYRLDLSTHLIGGAINNGGLLLDWVRRSWYSELNAQKGFSTLLSDAGNVPAGAEGLTLLPYLTGERSPYWRGDLSATLHGLKLTHGRPQVARAALEAVAFSLAQVWELLAGGTMVYSTGGLARSPLWNGLLSDVLGTPVRVAEAADASAIGAALLGHPSATLQAVRQRVQSAGMVLPGVENTTPLRDARARWQSLYVRLYG